MLWSRSRFFGPTTVSVLSGYRLNLNVAIIMDAVQYVLTCVSSDVIINYTLLYPAAMSFTYQTTNSIKHLINRCALSLGYTQTHTGGQYAHFFKSVWSVTTRNIYEHSIFILIVNFLRCNRRERKKNDFLLPYLQAPF